ncbi:MAG: DMT family transporter [Candidatus Dormibacteria bacterium]
MTRKLPLLALTSATVAVSFSAIFIRLSQSSAPVIVAGRLALTCLLLLPLAVRADRRIGRAEILPVLAAGLLLGFHFLAWTWSLSLTSVASAVFLICLHPIPVALLSPLVLGQRLTRRTILGVVLGVAGLLVLTGADLGRGAATVAGDLLALAGAAALAGYLLIGARLSRRSAASYSFWVYLVAASAGAAVALAGGPGTLAAQVGPDHWREFALLLGLAAVCTVGGHTVYNWALSRVPATAVSLSFLGEPLFTSVLAFLLLAGHPVPAAAAVTGGLVALAGAALAVSAGPRAEPAG